MYNTSLSLDDKPINTYSKSIKLAATPMDDDPEEMRKIAQLLLGSNLPKSVIDPFQPGNIEGKISFVSDN